MEEPQRSFLRAHSRSKPPAQLKGFPRPPGSNLVDPSSAKNMFLVVEIEQENLQGDECNTGQFFFGVIAVRNMKIQGVWCYSDEDVGAIKPLNSGVTATPLCSFIF